MAARPHRVTAILATRHGRPVFERYYSGDGPEGRADRQSITKSVVAFGVARLTEHSAIELEKPVSLPGIDIGNSYRDQPITLAHLLEHTAGFDDMHFNETFAPLEAEGLRLTEVLAVTPDPRVSNVGSISIVFDQAVTGFTDKFSQADWDPADPTFSGIQVLYDPGWLLKWIGSLTIVAGIYTIFYLRPYRSRRPEDSVDEALRKKKHQP
jgi:hypothetical protein